MNERHSDVLSELRAQERCLEMEMLEIQVFEGDTQWQPGENELRP